ncbi:hypothetical protein AAVH_28220 [Aphelenchoides avenae]|nr:hypothetical protein AAVH_28220 [Aphelenchus avenae]
MFGYAAMLTLCLVASLKQGNAEKCEERSASYADAAAAAITKSTKSTPKKAVRPRRK